MTTDCKNIKYIIVPGNILSGFYVFLLLLILSVTVSAQIKNQETPNGYNIFYYPNGQISSEGYMVNGVPDGIWKAYYVNGKLKSVGKRFNMKLDSVWTFYYDNGLISEKINYLNGMKNGYDYHYKFYNNESDSLISYLYSEELFVNNKRNGIATYYYKNGTIRERAIFKEGKKHGIAREYDISGRLVAIVDYRYGKVIDKEIINQYKDSLKVGVWKEFYPNGKIKREESYTDGKLNGVVRFYDLSGQLISTYRYENDVLVDTALTLSDNIDIKVEYYSKRDSAGELIKKSSGAFVDGVPIGVHRTYDSLGRVNSSRLYDKYGNLIAEGIVDINGDKLGFWKYYYSSGDIKSEGKYSKNRRTGKWIYYYKSGKTEQVGFFRRGVPDGKWIWYFESSSVKREEFYRLGKEEGESVEYDEYGTVVARGSYVEGLKEGEWYYNFYFHTEKGNYKDGLRDGVWNYYYSDGTLYFTGKFVQGYEDGKHLYYYNNSKLKEVRYYSFGRKIKNWEYYDYYGSLIRILSYDNDKLVKIDGISVATE